MLGVKPRAGFSVAELLVAIALLGIVGGAIHDALRRQQQLFSSIATLIAARSDVRDAAEVLATDLLSASRLDTIRVASDSAVEFLSGIGVSITCDSAPEHAIRLPPEKLASGLRLTSLLAVPDTNDLVLIYNDDSTATAGQPRWDRHAIESVAVHAAGTACPATTGFTSVADEAAPALVITVRTPASSGIRKGAPVRIVRRGRYSLYRSSDARWYLGHRRCTPLGPSSCGAIQPLSGPYAGYAGAESGLSIAYFGATGEPLVSGDAGPRTALIQITVRSLLSTSHLRGRGWSAQHVDSATASVALRNRD